MSDKCEMQTSNTIKKNQFQGELSIDFDLSWHNKCDIMFSVSRMHIAILNLWTILLCCALTCLILSRFFSAKAKRASARKLEEFSAAFSMLQLKFCSNVVAKWTWSRHARPSDEGQYCSCGVTEFSADKKNKQFIAHSSQFIDQVLNCTHMLRHLKCIT